MRRDLAAFARRQQGSETRAEAEVILEVNSAHSPQQAPTIMDELGEATAAGCGAVVSAMALYPVNKVKMVMQAERKQSKERVLAVTAQPAWAGSLLAHAQSFVSSA